MTTLQQIIQNLQAWWKSINLSPNLSQVAVWQKISDAIAPIIDNTKSEFTNTQNIIQNIINTQNYGKADWYENIALAYQHGIDMVAVPVTLNGVTTLQNQYAIVPPTAPSVLIIKQAAFGINSTNGNQQLYLKIAMSDPTGQFLQAVTNTLPTYYLNNFKNYFLATANLCGLPVNITTANPNLLSYGSIKIVYNAGNSLTTLQSNIISALQTFRNTFPFNGTLYIGGNKGLENYIENNVPGVIDFIINEPMLDGHILSIFDPINDDNNFATLPAGYFDYGQSGSADNPSTPTGIYADIKNVKNFVAQ